MNDSPLFKQPAAPLKLSTKLAYGVGEVASSAITNLRVFFLLYFLTNVAGLNAALAGTILLIGRVWDAVNDPVIGWLSDRTRSRWGRRHPWMMAAALPFGLFCFLQWVVPRLNVSPDANQSLLFWYYVIISLLFDTAYTAVTLPYSALAPEITEDYHERTSLISIQMAFSVAAGISALFAAQIIFSLIPDAALKYQVLGAGCAVVSVLVIYLCVWGTRRHTRSSLTAPLAPPLSGQRLIAQVQSVFSHRAFQIVTGTYVLAWVSVQVSAAMLPYYVQEWMQLPETHVTQMAIAVQATTFTMIFVWGRVSRRLGKKAVFLLGIPAAIAGQIGFFFVQPTQLGWMYSCGVAIGIGLAAIYLIPWSMLPDVIDLDDLRHGERREGLFYGFMVQLQKVGLAIAVFLVGQGLNWAGLIATSAGQPKPIQPASVGLAVRLAIGPLPTLALIVSLLLVTLYPISRELHTEIRLQLNERAQPGDR